MLFLLLHVSTDFLQVRPFLLQGKATDALQLVLFSLSAHCVPAPIGDVIPQLVGALCTRMVISCAFLSSSMLRDDRSCTLGAERLVSKKKDTNQVLRAVLLHHWDCVRCAEAEVACSRFSSSRYLKDETRLKVTSSFVTMASVLHGPHLIASLLVVHQVELESVNDETLLRAISSLLNAIWLFKTRSIAWLIRSSLLQGEGLHPWPGVGYWTSHDVPKSIFCHVSRVWSLSSTSHLGSMLHWCVVEDLHSLLNDESIKRSISTSRHIDMSSLVQGEQKFCEH